MPQVVGLGEGGDGAFDAGRVVELDDLGAVRRVGELQAQDLGVLLGLLHTVAREPVVGLGLDHGDREVRAVAQQVVRALLRATPRLATGEEDAAVGEGPLLVDHVGRVVPPRRLEARDNEPPAGVGLSHEPSLSYLMGPWQPSASQTPYGCHARPPRPPSRPGACARVRAQAP